MLLGSSVTVEGEEGEGDASVPGIKTAITNTLRIPTPLTPFRSDLSGRVIPTQVVM